MTTCFFLCVSGRVAQWFAKAMKDALEYRGVKVFFDQVMPSPMTFYDEPERMIICGLPLRTTGAPSPRRRSRKASNRAVRYFSSSTTSEWLLLFLSFHMTRLTSPCRHITHV